MAKKDKLLSTIKWYSPTNRKNRYYFNKDGTPKTVVRTGGSTGGGGLSGGGKRNQSQLKKYYQYYTGDGTVWAAINSMALNTVMTGYDIHSNNDKAKKVITDFCRNTDIESYMTYAMIYALVFGDSFVELVYKKDGKHISRFKLFDPVTMTVNYDNYGDVINYQQEIGGQKQKPLDPKFVFHLNVFPKSDDPYGISLIEPSKDTIMRKVKTDTAIANAIIKHGTSKYVATIGTEKEKQLPPKQIMDKIKADLEDISGQNEFVIPWNVKIDTIDEKGVQGVEEYFNYFQTQAITGLMCPEEALGLGKGPLHPDTELFVKDKGFVKITEVMVGDEILTYNQNTGEMEYQPNKKNWTYPVDEDLYHFKGQTYDLMTTDDHRMFYRGQHKDDFSVTTAKNLPTRFEMMVGGFKWKGRNKKYEVIPEMEIFVGDRWHEGVTHQVSIQQEKKIPMNLWLEFLGYFISEGYTTINDDGYTVGIRQYPGDNYNKMKDCLSKLPFKVNIYEDRFTIHSKQLAKHLSPLGKSHEKYIPKHIKELPPSKLEILYDALMVGDGCQNNYFTSSKQLANDVQEIILKMGYGSTIYTRDRIGNDVTIHGKTVGKCNYLQYTVTKNIKNLTPEICTKDTKGHKSTLHKEHYKGLVHCVTVDNGLILARYNGKVSVTGNSTEACYDEETETLTKDGWKKYTDLKNNDLIATFNQKTSSIEYHKPIDSVDTYRYNHNGDMIHFKSDDVDILVTPNHRMFVNLNPNDESSKWEIVSAEDLLNTNHQFAFKTILNNKPNKIQYISSDNVSRIHYNGITHCLNVPNHIYVTRRNGKVAIQGNTALVKATLYERTIKSFQLRLARQIETQIFSRVLESEGIDPEDVYVTMKFKSVTEQDETQRAKWVANLLEAFKNTDKKPLTINEVRSMFDKEPIDEPWADSLDWSLNKKDDKDD